MTSGRTNRALSVADAPSGYPSERHARAEWWPRFGAWMLDGAIAFTIALVAAIPFGMLDSSNDGAGGLWFVLAASLCTAYFAVTMCRGGERNGQTLGKQAVGLRVIRDDGLPVGVWTVLFRELLLKVIVGWITVFGWLADGLWPLRDRDHHAIHDLIASTHVVAVRRGAAKPSPVVAVAPKPLAADIQRHLAEAQAAQARIHEAIQRAALPYTEVGQEVDSLIEVLGHSAQRAQLLHEALEDTPIAGIEARLEELKNSDNVELIDALAQQLEVQQRMQRQLDRFKVEMERIAVELKTIRGGLLNVSASSDVDNRQVIAERVRGLCDDISSVATGMSAAFDADQQSRLAGPTRQPTPAGARDGRRS